MDQIIVIKGGQYLEYKRQERKFRGIWRDTKPQTHTVRTVRGQKTHIERQYVPLRTQYVPLRTQYVLLWTHLPTVRKVFTKVRTVFGSIRIT